jgi:hypothetical protein
MKTKLFRKKSILTPSPSPEGEGSAAFLPLALGRGGRGVRTKIVQTRLIVSLMVAAAMVFASCNKENYPQDSESTTSDPPTYAASNKIWVFGEQTWSDAIHMPECNKETFDGGYWNEPKADCRSYTYEGKTYYYYSWPYVDAHKATMCPSPWRVPTKDDFELLADKVSYTELIVAWGYGGSIYGSSLVNVEPHGAFWSSTVYNSALRFQLYYEWENVTLDQFPFFAGLQVRCVK